jgi:EAL domain-containing protein (putative c-di-GMP-specific phosphodiesterase class I)
MEALEEGALQYLVKPVKSEALLRTAARAVGLARIARLKRRALEYLGLDDKLVGDRAGLEAGFARALGALWMAYQPILRASDGTLYGYEALLRSTDPLLTDAGAMLDAAERLGRQRELGQTVRSAVLASLPAEVRAGTVSLFVNVQAEDLDETFTTPLLAARVPTVLEVTERVALRAIPDLQARVQRLRHQGFRIAIDDLGAGYAGLTSFAALEPDIVKLDMALVRGVHAEPLKQKLIASLTTVCRDLNILVVAEGIEVEQEREAVSRLGCDLLQGFLLGRPEAAP